MEESDQSEWMALLNRSRQGEERALDLLLGRIRPEVVRYLRHRLQSHPATDALAEELAQEVLIRVARSIDECRATNRASLRSWTRTIARRVAIDWHRRRKMELGRRVWEASNGVENRAVARALSASMPGVGDAGDDESIQVLGRLLYEAQEVLSEDTRQVIRRRLLYGDTWEQVGEMIGTSAGGAKRRWQRAVTRMRSELIERAEELPRELRRTVLNHMGCIPDAPTG